MATFEDLYTDVLDYVNRPASEMLTQSKREVNHALLWFQRKYKFKMTERLVRVVYPASTLHIDLTEACEGTLRDIISAQLMSDITSNRGKVIKVRSYDNIIRARSQYQGRFDTTEYEDVENPPGDRHTEYVQDVNERILFLVGENSIGLYPTPTADTNLLLHLHIWLPELVEPTDTNFLLNYATDLILMRAVKRMCIYLKEDNRMPYAQAEFDEGYKSLLDWDSTIKGFIE